MNSYAQILDRTYQKLLVWIFRIQKMNEPAHEALFLSKVLRVLWLLWLVILVLNQAVDDGENGVHLE